MTLLLICSVPWLVLETAAVLLKGGTALYCRYWERRFAKARQRIEWTRAQMEEWTT